MKRLLLIASCLATTMGMAQPKVTFNEKMHNFGEILWKQPVQVSFVVGNEGTSPLVISNVTTSCGCTVAQWTKEPIEAGQSGEVTATFDAKMLGRFYKTVGVYCNAAPEPIYLELIGVVKETVAQPAVAQDTVAVQMEEQPAVKEKSKKKGNIFKKLFSRKGKKDKTNATALPQ